MEYTHDEYCDMLLTLGACYSRAGTAAREYALRYPGRRHPDANVFRRLEQGLRETGSVTPTALVNAGRPRTVQTPANEDDIITVVEREPWRSSRDIARELGLSQQRVLEVLHDDQLHPYHYCGANICFQTIVLYRCNFANRYDINTLRMSSFYTTFCGQRKRDLRVRVCSTSTAVTSGHGLILMLSANVGIKSASASAFGLVSSGSLSWAPICYLTCWLLNDIVIFWKLFYQGCLKMCLWLWGRGCGFSTTELQRTMGKMSGSGWTRHIREGGLYLDDRLHGPLCRRI
jgi:hypothetical protein